MPISVQINNDSTSKISQTKAILLSVIVTVFNLKTVRNKMFLLTGNYMHSRHLYKNDEIMDNVFHWEDVKLVIPPTHPTKTYGSLISAKGNQLIDQINTDFSSIEIAVRLMVYDGYPDLRKYTANVACCNYE
ncbi:hypothetical protein CHUAL_008646 [Chamberlinius hualienensis]